ncbi:MAG: HEAT repeat domain-containing protein, partial [Asgard group archaeon]|nr:HEAT repeat domain-containing protein [Asgard group archaeon]
DLDVLSNIQLVKLVRHLMDYSEKRPAIKIIRLLYALKVILNELFFDVDPTEITAETRTQLIGAYNELEKYPPKETLSFIRHYIDINLKPRSTGLSDVVYLIRIFNLKEYETDLLSIAKRNNLNLEEQVDLIGCLGDIGSEKSAAFIRQKIKQFLKNHPRKVIAQSNVNYSRLIDFDRDYEQTKLKYINYLYSEKIYDYYSDEDLTNIFYWYSIRSLSKISSKESISLFLEALDDSDPKIRYEAIKGLINNNVYNSEIEEKLVYLARNDKKVSIQSQALLALGSLNSQSAIPLFINHIYEAIEKKVFTIVSEIDSIYDNRWEFSFNKEKDFHHENKDSAEKDENSQTLPKFNKKYLDEDIVNWLNIHNKQKFSFFELREDFKSVLENNNFILDDFTLKEQYNPFLEKEELNEEWDYTISEKFRKLILVDVSLEAMKRTEAELPINELIEILDYELDDEILLDILIILAKRGINFARKELIELFDQNNYIRAREIIETLGSLTPHEFSKIAYSLKKSPDWILQDFLKNFQK